MKVHHIGHLVRDIEKAKVMFHALGFVNASETYYDESRDIDIVFLENDGYKVELVAPRSEKSVIWKHLKRSGSTPYHFCFSVHDIEKQIKIKEEEGYITLQAPSKAPAIANRNVAFLYSPDIGIIELVEEVP